MILDINNIIQNKETKKLRKVTGIDGADGVSLYIDDKWKYKLFEIQKEYLFVKEFSVVQLTIELLQTLKEIWDLHALCHMEKNGLISLNNTVHYENKNTPYRKISIDHLRRLHDLSFIDETSLRLEKITDIVTDEYTFDYRNFKPITGERTGGCDEIYA